MISPKLDLLGNEMIFTTFKGTDGGKGWLLDEEFEREESDDFEDFEDPDDFDDADDSDDEEEASSPPNTMTLVSATFLLTRYNL